MISNLQILSAANVAYSSFEGRLTIFVTKGNQLLGDYNILNRLPASYQSKGVRPYAGWHTHHIVEKQDLERLGITGRFPDHKKQLCVLLPKEAHVDRINNILRHRNPSRYSATAPELMSAYQEAYALVGNYSGGGELTIKNELLGIVQAAFRLGQAVA